MHVEELLRLPEVRDVLGERYREGVRAAVEGFPHSRADEDTVTGALGQSLLGRGWFQLADGRMVTWRTSYERFGSSSRGRGRRDKGAEPRYGGDGIFEIQFTDEEGVTTRKSLLFQAKKEAYRYGDANLRKQARQIASVPGGGIIIDYRPGSFVAVDAGDVARPSRGLETRDVTEKDLADVLADEFVMCTRGSSAYFYDPDTETIHIFTVGGRVMITHLPLDEGIRTKLQLFPPT